MSQPFHVDTDNLNAWGSRVRVRAADMPYQGDPGDDTDGGWASHQSMKRFHGQVGVTAAGIGDDLNAHADHADSSAAQYRQQDGNASEQMKALSSVGTDLLKGVESAGADALKTGASMFTSTAQAGVQAVTTAANGMITAGATGAKGGAPGAPGGAALPLQPGQGSVPDSPTTDHPHDKDRGHDDTHADADQ